MRTFIENCVIAVLAVIMIAMLVILVHNIWVYGWMY